MYLSAADCFKVRLTSGSLAIFSPVALTEAAKAKVASLGNDLRYIIAGDVEHHIFLSDWAAAYPNAKLIGPEGLPEKRLKAADSDPKIGKEPFAAVFTRENKTNLAASIGEDFARDFDVEYVHAHPNRELVFLFKPEKTLIQADLLFNLPAEEQYSRVPEGKPKLGLLGRLFESMQTTKGEAVGMKRFLWHVVSRKDRASFNESVRRIEKWDFETVVPCHGETIVGNGKEVFRKVFAWHLDGVGGK
jgi:glyoxylase-like metal-dependent hydrolase (beta-lactamase superfamily II)